MSRKKSGPSLRSLRRKARTSNPFVHIRRVLEARLRELIALQDKIAANKATGLALLASTPERVEIGSRIAEAREIADRIGALAYERYGQLLTLSDRLVASAGRSTEAQS